jgi:hypothetical protein
MIDDKPRGKGMKDLNLKHSLELAGILQGQ